MLKNLQKSDGFKRTDTRLQLMLQPSTGSSTSRRCPLPCIMNTLYPSGKGCKNKDYVAVTCKVSLL